MIKNKKNIVLALALFALALVMFLSENKAGTVYDVLNENIGPGYETVKEVLEFIELNDEGDTLCVFETDGKMAVAYLNCVGEDKYKFGIAVEYSPFWEIPSNYDISCLKAGDSDLLIKYVVTSDDVSVKESTKKYTFNVGDSKQALHIISVEETKCSGYVYYLETK